jgi:hypothetical protein
MGEKRPRGEKEYNPLDDTRALIGHVLKGGGDEAPAPEAATASPNASEAPPQQTAQVFSIVERSAKESKEDEVSPVKRPVPKEEMVTCKFKVPKTDYHEAKRILAQLEQLLGAHIDLANLGRGWLTRLVTAEKELLDAAQHHEPLKSANTRNPLEVAEVDHAMTVIQSLAFRRAKPIR